MHFNATRHPTARWTAQQIVEACPWHNPYVERLIGSIRRDCMNFMIILNADHLKQILTGYFDYYHQDRTHLGLGKETPSGRSVLEKWIG